MNKEEDKKTCIKCNNPFPASKEFFFYRNKVKGWLSSWCKICHKSHVKKNSQRNNELQRARRRKESNNRVCKSCRVNPLGAGRRKCNECIAENKSNNRRKDKSIRRKRLKRAMPIWANKSDIKNFYLNRPEGMHVDHIIPLSGNNVCGLHVIDNLQYLNAYDNMIKSNKFEHEGVK